MTVKELIEKLQKLNPDLEVVTYDREDDLIPVVLVDVQNNAVVIV